MYTFLHESPIGPLRLAADDSGLRHIILPYGGTAFELPDEWIEDASKFDQLRVELDQYFAGIRQTFTVKLSPSGTDFQQSVWRALQDIDYADTCTYGHIANQIGKPKASRAVGAANGANPIPIIVPCHRVIGTGGRLTGFGGGLPTKAWLLSHERGEGQLFGITSP